MNEITDYTVLRGTFRVGHDGSLEVQVQKLICMGWQPLGSAMPINSDWVTQTMVKYKGH